MIATLTSQPECQLVGVTSTALLGFIIILSVGTMILQGLITIRLEVMEMRIANLERSQSKIEQPASQQQRMLGNKAP